VYRRIAVLLKLLYWLVVLAVSLALLVALVLFFESRDDSSIGAALLALSRANTTIL
jgi:hypothetical protein